MLKIAICDDTTEERELVEQYARRYFQKQNRPVELETFPSMQDVLVQIVKAVFLLSAAG